MPHEKPSEPFLLPAISYDTFSLYSYSQYNDPKADFLKWSYPELFFTISNPLFQIFYPHQKESHRPTKLITT